MHRRRMLLAAALLIAVLSTAFWFWPAELTAEEEPYVGVWRWKKPRFGTLTFLRDHRCVRQVPMRFPNVSSGRWWVRDGRIFLDFEPNPIWRALRPLLTRLNVPIAPVGSTTTADFDLVGDPDTIAIFVRADPE
jgi:hypothetical protein